MKKSILMLTALLMLGACASDESNFLSKVKNKEMFGDGVRQAVFSEDGKTVTDQIFGMKYLLKEVSSKDTAIYYMSDFLGVQMEIQTKDGKTGFATVSDITSSFTLEKKK